MRGAADQGGQGSGAEGGASAGAATGKGGVKGGRLSAPLAQTVTPPASNSPTYSARYQSARARAETAIAQERVPARLRTYIRDYFLAIHPTERP